MSQDNFGSPPGAAKMPTLRKPIRPFFNPGGGSGAGGSSTETENTAPQSSDPSPTHKMPTLRKPIKPFFNPDTPVETEDSGEAIFTLAIFSFLMFSVPIAVFFYVQDYMVTNEYDEMSSIFAPVLGAIIAVNLIIVLYVIRALQVERRGQKKSVKTE